MPNSQILNHVVYSTCKFFKGSIDSLLTYSSSDTARFYQAARLVRYQEMGAPSQIQAGMQQLRNNPMLSHAEVSERSVSRMATHIVNQLRNQKPALIQAVLASFTPAETAHLIALTKFNAGQQSAMARYGTELTQPMMQIMQPVLLREIQEQLGMSAGGCPIQ
ncbi:MAG: hypothetical protein KGJ02_08705 [Verrucomicrobiota bacterium]|nr:hypothetical protein [Verrucomicrobiota bacterium]